MPDRPDPQLLIGAGHGTHLALLGAKRARAGKVIVLMKPSLPVNWFDLCLIPEHDDIPDRKNVIRTRGPLNQVRANPDKTPGKGLILAGGPSKHFSWDTGLLEDQILQIINRENNYQWILTDSPRTPDSSKRMFSQLASTDIVYKPFSAVSRDWLAEELATSTVAWVTKDSVSMIFEALTAGAKVGLLEVPPKRRGRLSNAINRLADDGMITSFTDWRGGQKMRAAKVPLDEATRCAHLVLERFSLSTSIDGQR